ncbi:MAG: GerAB/ArcD/ProY family transporter [Christensenellales bacterium]|jgi:spore germination protein KB
MTIDKGQISGTRLMLTIACFIQASSLLTSFLLSVTLQDSWIVVLIGTVLCLPLIWIYRELMLTFPGKNLIQILKEVYGPVVGKILGAMYLWHFLTLASVNLIDMAETSKMAIMGEMPVVTLAIMCAVVCAYAVRHGIKSVTWPSALFTFAIIPIVIVTLMLTANQIDLQNLFPMMDQPVMKYVQGVHIISTIPFGELVIITMFNPNVKLTRKGSLKYMFGGFLLGALTVLVVVLRDLTVLGNTISLFAQPSLVTLRMVRLGEALSRMEILFSIILVILLFYKIAVLYYVTVLCVAQLFETKNYRRLVAITGALMVAYGLTLFPNMAKHADHAQKITPFLWTFFEILVPFLTLLVAKARKLPVAAKEA